MTNTVNKQLERVGALQQQLASVQRAARECTRGTHRTTAGEARSSNSPGGDSAKARCFANGALAATAAVGAVLSINPVTGPVFGGALLAANVFSLVNCGARSAGFHAAATLPALTKELEDAKQLLGDLIQEEAASKASPAPKTVQPHASGAAGLRRRP